MNFVLLAVCPRALVAPLYLVATARYGFEESVDQVFCERPRAAMVYEGDFVASELGNDTGETMPTLGQDFRLLRLPGDRAL